MPRSKSAGYVKTINTGYSVRFCALKLFDFQIPTLRTPQASYPPTHSSFSAVTTQTSLYIRLQLRGGTCASPENNMFSKLINWLIARLANVPAGYSQHSRHNTTILS